MAMTPDELIDTSMMLIVHSGDARAAAFHALQEAKAGNYEEATAKAPRSICCWFTHRTT